MAMTIEAGFLATAIGKAKCRLSFQAALVQNLPTGCTPAVAARETRVLQTLNDKVVDLRRKAADLHASGDPTRSVDLP